jgi:hypothetical protein
MRRLARCRFNAFTILSLLLCVGTVTEWARSHQIGKEVEVRVGSGVEYHVHSFRFNSGIFTYQRTWASDWERDPTHLKRYWHDRQPRVRWTQWEPQLPEPSDNLTNNLGFGLDHGVLHYGGEHFVLVSFPLWVPGLIFSLLPLRRAGRYLLRRSLVRKKHCVNCGYDLRATPDRCPECGTIPAVNTTGRRHGDQGE